MDKRIQTKLQTIQRHNSKLCKVFSLKIIKSKLNKQTKKQLNDIFHQAKYFYNYCLSKTNLNSIDTKLMTVPVKIIDKFEDRNLDVLSGQMKQSIKTKIFSNINTLHTLKLKHKKVGKLKFKSKLHSIPLKQYNITYKLDIKNSQIKLQNIKQKIKVSGMNQIPQNVEFANANLICKNNDYFLNITTYVDKSNVSVPETSIGIDFGCQNQLTLSNGIKINYEIKIPKKLKRLDRKIMKKNRKRSNNKIKDQLKRQKIYTKLNNKKKDIRNKIVNVLTKNYKYICFQDENINAWKSSNHGKKIQNTGLGGIIRDLKNKSYTPILVDQFYPSTQICPQCNVKNKLSQNERTYFCQSCGYEEDRDIKAAICIEKEGLRNYKEKNSNLNITLPTERREVKLEEIDTSVFFALQKVNNISICRESSIAFGN